MGLRAEHVWQIARRLENGVSVFFLLAHRQKKNQKKNLPLLDEINK